MRLLSRYRAFFPEIDYAQAQVEAMRMGLRQDALLIARKAIESAKDLFPDDSSFSSAVREADLLVSGLLKVAWSRCPQ